MLAHHSKEHLLYPKEKDFYKYYNTIDVDVYYSKNTIVFIIHTPIMFPSSFFILSFIFDTNTKSFNYYSFCPLPPYQS